MLFRISRVLTTFALLAAAGSANSAFAQFGYYGCNPCCCPPIVVQPCFKTVAMTEMREVRQVVQKPVVETKYVDQQVTEYRQVVEAKTAEVPTVSYQNVTEMQTVQRDCGHWMTQMHCRSKMAPCQYDSRPDIMGFLNRTQYSVRMAFTPDYYAERIYVPNVVSQQIPVTRQVAIRGTQTINYNVAKVVPVQSTRRVAINTVRMESQEIVTQRPVTVMKVVPFGSTLAYGTPASGTTASNSPAGGASGSSALAETPDSEAKLTTPINPRQARKPNPAERMGRGELREETPAELEEKADPNPTIRRGGGSQRSQILRRPDFADDNWQFASNDEPIRPTGKWVARKKPSTGPTLQEITIASNDVK